ncbi:hypothetical protein ZWY2020_028471 [Hordeum vulgare]|nr:hypothetical protein ZWY2020_028471 [Hordeum vulgare]
MAFSSPVISSDSERCTIVNLQHSQLISGSHNAYDYYGESDVETDLEDEMVDAPISGESQSSVNMSEVTEDEGKENVQDKL